MTDIADLSHPQAIAMEVLAAYAAHKSLTPFSSRPGGLTLDQSTRVLPMLRAAFEARGEKILGRKIGFTNRSIWAQYGVDAPIWGYVTSATTHDLASLHVLPARDFCEPRIEPEIMFGLKAPPCSTARCTRCATSSICWPTTRTIRLWPRARSSRPAP